MHLDLGSQTAEQKITDAILTPQCLTEDTAGPKDVFFNYIKRKLQNVYLFTESHIAIRRPAGKVGIWALPFP